ncbi:MAG: coproporphyrinogen-III oxidase family protein [Myxococcota bacterium]
MINTRTVNDYWLPSRKGFITNYPNFMQWKRLTAMEMENRKPLNLYLHMPYCIQRCSYCYYKTVNLRGAEKQQRMSRYVDALCRELALASKVYHLSDRPVISVYFGGGTPSLLAPELLIQINETLRQYYRLENAEYTIEAEPVTLTEEKAAVIMSMGATRISMGIQSFDTEIIKNSHRLDDEKKALRAIGVAKETGAVVNIDLMSGLAGETPQTWEHSVLRAIQTGVESITVYKTELYPNTEYYRNIKNSTLELPSDDDELKYVEHAVNELEKAEYIPWSFYTFTRHGKHAHVHSPSVFRGDDIYAFGTSAFGKLGGYLFQNTNDEDKYVEMITHEELPVQRGHLLTALDSMVRDVVLTMKLVRFDLRYFEQKYGVKLEVLCASAIEALCEGGLITHHDNALHLTQKGILYGDYAGKCLARSLISLGKGAPELE